METLVYLLYGMLGVLIGSLLSILPGLHPLNFAGLGVVIYLGLLSVGIPIDALGMGVVFAGMLIGFAVVGTITTTFMGSPDDSTMYMAFPNQKYLMYGRGYEASVATGIGSMGSVMLLLLLAPLAGIVFPIFRKITTPHFPWILIGVTAYILQSEWPKDWGSRAKTQLGRLKEGWASLSAGWVTFFLAMMLGFIVLNVPVVPVDRAFQNIMPVFVGFFAVPWVLTNMASRATIPPQTVSNNFYISKKDMARGTTSGFVGGMFAAYEPIITAGVGGVLAGHSTSTSGDVQFMISGSAGRFAYYVGAFFLFWVPLLHLTRGGMAWVTGVIYQPRADTEFWLLMSAIAISTVFAFLLLVFLSRVIAKKISGMSYTKISMLVLSLIIGLVFGFISTVGTDLPLLFVAMLATTGMVYVILLALSRAVKVASKSGRSKLLPHMLVLVGLAIGFVMLEWLIVGGEGLRAGVSGLLILTISTGLGLVPPMFRTRRLNLILGFFFPIFLNMAGIGAGISRLLGVY